MMSNVETRLGGRIKEAKSAARSNRLSEASSSRISDVDHQSEDDDSAEETKERRPLDEKMLDVPELIQRLTRAKKYTNVKMKVEEIEVLCDKVKKILLERPMLLEMKAPITVLGDLHGQYFDLLHILDVIKYPSPTNQLLCLGDYVDRGQYGVETVVLLFALKLQHPDSVHLLRGNHESASVTRVYGFYDECKKKLDLLIWRRFMEVFDCLPVAALISKAILCMHGGLSPHLKTLEDIRRLPRPSDIPPGGLFTDLLWADPDKKLEGGWAENPRGVSFIFSKAIVKDFCKKFRIDLILRAHQVVYSGYELFADDKLMTLFTAPNFCGQFENMGGISLIDKNLKMELKFIDANATGEQRKPKPTEAYVDDKWVAKLDAKNKTKPVNPKAKVPKAPPLPPRASKK